MDKSNWMEQKVTSSVLEGCNLVENSTRPDSK